MFRDDGHEQMHEGTQVRRRNDEAPGSERRQTIKRRVISRRQLSELSGTKEMRNGGTELLWGLGGDATHYKHSYLAR